MEEFLRSKPMLAPAVAGATTVMITGSLVMQFGLAGSATALIVSFVMGLFTWWDKTVPLIQRFVFYLVNSFTIFSVAMGLNSAGVAITKSDAQSAYESRWVPPESEGDRFFRPWF